MDIWLEIEFSVKYDQKQVGVTSSTGVRQPANRWHNRSGHSFVKLTLFLYAIVTTHIRKHFNMNIFKRKKENKSLK